jgi:hypothetical protein
MTIQRSMVRGIAVLGAAASAMVVAPAVSSAAPAAATGTRANEAANVQTAPTAVKGVDAGICGYSGGKQRGCVSFKSYGEILTVCDTRADGRKVYGQLRSGNRILTLLDRNGAKKGCYAANLRIPEGTPIAVRVVVEGLGYTRWDYGRA